MWKVWIINDENKEAGGIYLFEDADTLNAYLGGSKPKIANLQAAANRKIIQAVIVE